MLTRHSTELTDPGWSHHWRTGGPITLADHTSRWSHATGGRQQRAPLRSHPASGWLSTVVATFSTLGSCGQALEQIFCGGLHPSMAEIMDRQTMEAIERQHPMGVDTGEAALLYLQFDDGDRSQAAELSAQHCTNSGATFAYATDDVTEAEQLLAARKMALPALEALGAVLLDDVVVPRRHLVELLASIERIAADHDVKIATFGHAGDGNLHPTILLDDSTQDSAWRAFHAVIDAAVVLGGHVTGEHGIGTLKRDVYLSTISAPIRELTARLRTALDPDGLLNPGKVLR